MCLICDRIQMIKDEANPFFVKELETGYVVLGDTQRIEGYTLFLCKKHETELFDLDEDFATKYMKEMIFVAKAVKNAFRADKINYECLGQGDAHLHWHLFPRHEGDLGNYGNHGKGPVWWLPMEEFYADENCPSKEELFDLKQRLKAELERIVDISGTILKTSRLTLREFEQTDLDDFHEYASVDGVGQMAGWLPHQDKDETQRILDIFIGGRDTFAIVKDDKVIGSVGIKKFSAEKLAAFSNKKGCELGFVLSKDYWGQGIMPEAVLRVIDWLFEEQGMDFISCEHFVTNRQSKRVQEKCGFKYVKDSVYETSYGKIEQVKVNVLERKDWKEGEAGGKD